MRLKLCCISHRWKYLPQANTSDLCEMVFQICRHISKYNNIYSSISKPGYISSDTLSNKPRKPNTSKRCELVFSKSNSKFIYVSRGVGLFGCDPYTFKNYPPAFLHTQHRGPPCFYLTHPSPHAYSVPSVLMVHRSTSTGGHHMWRSF